MAAKKTSGLDRRKVVAALLADRGDALVVTGLGSPTYDTFAAGDHDLNFYLWGGMGGAAMAGLGLALAQPKRRVLVITGDGEMLMGLGSLATVAAQRPANLAIAVIDNQRYGETGGQWTHAAFGSDLAGIARAAGITRADTLGDLAAVEAFRARLHGAMELCFATIKVAPENAPMVLPPRDGVLLKQRFRAAVLTTVTR